MKASINLEVALNAEDVRDLFLAGWTTKEVKERYNITSQELKEFCDIHGIISRKPRTEVSLLYVKPLETIALQQIWNTKKELFKSFAYEVGLFEGTSPDESPVVEEVAQEQVVAKAASIDSNTVFKFKLD